MKDYYKVQPDEVKLLQKHFTKGRGGHRIKYITRHHLAMVGGTAAVWQVWQSRQASAHYVVDPNGRTGQLVWDSDVAWANANATSNRETIAIEHSNSAGAPGWPISDATIIAGARLAAALCLFYKLGRPVFGHNIRDHRQFTGTSCPHHLAFGGKYHDRWMSEAQRFYDLLAAGKVHPDGSLKEPELRKEPKDVLTIKFFVDFIKGPRASGDVAVFGALYGAPKLFPGICINDFRLHGVAFLAIARGCPGLSTRLWMQVLWR